VWVDGETGKRSRSLSYIDSPHEKRAGAPRLDRLRAAGLSDEELAHLSSPIGLDLGARTPEETAVSIAAEIIALRWGGGGGRLARMDGRIHHGQAVPEQSAP